MYQRASVSSIVWIDGTGFEEVEHVEMPRLYPLGEPWGFLGPLTVLSAFGGTGVSPAFVTDVDGAGACFLDLLGGEKGKGKRAGSSISGNFILL